ncbi:glycosyltransferase [Pseudomonas sp. FP198]|jgi:rhamnosyltransferase|uniref:glycosyltransferase n=1 Tax=Pseudomonas sp. FP198 TaxID=2954084 RepID=UPI00273545EF|nr:glycosyltransferase [Pseudomonas sp. FP198]WLG97377.1 glycosyltransferase [Pseudomonas sp. FP198]
MPVKYPRVAVLLAACNGIQWIEEQLLSILCQSASDVTVFISIDPSTDGTSEWCTRYAATNKRVEILPPSDTLGGAARNFFRLLRDVSFEDYDYVAFADQDDIWHEDKLERATHAIQIHGVDVYSSNVTAFWPDGKTRLLDKAQAQVRWDYLFEAAGPGCTYVMSQQVASAIKKSILANWADLQSVSLHDWYCYAFARSRNFKWFIDPKPSLQYRQHERNQFGANVGLRSLILRYQTIHDGWWFSQIRLIARLVGETTDPFVQSWLSMERVQLLKLSFSAWRCRRRVRDKCLFFLICWAAALFGVKGVRPDPGSD